MKNIKLQITLIIFLISSLPSLAQLNPGDIMIIGFMGDGDGTPIPTATDPPSANCGDGFSFVVLVDIPAGTEVTFTEGEWDGGFVSGDEGHVVWTNDTGGSIPAGTVIQITTHGQAEAVACGGLIISTGTASFGNDGSGTNNWALSSSNEEIYVYQGTPGNPTNWISAFFTDDFNVNSFVPAVLNGFVVNLESVDSDADIAVYEGSLDCSVPGSCITNITNPANWSTDNGPGFQCCDAIGAEYPEDVPVAFIGFCEPPVIVCPADVTISCDTSTDPASTGVASATDGCGAVIISFSDSEVTGQCTNERIITRVWIATDENGDTGICSQIITVIDDVAPVPPAAPADLVLQCAADVPALVDLTATDNCNGDITASPTVQITSGSCANDFTMVRTWTFEDECGNASIVSQTIIVKDDLAPVAPAAPADLVLQCAADVPAPVDLTATDNCNGDITESPTVQISPGSCANDFTMVRTWTFVDLCGNASSVSQTIIVKDDLAPVAPAAPADITVSCANDVPAPVDLTALDNCGGPMAVSPTVQITPGTCENDFTMVRTWTFEDECGNTSSVSQTITVKDDLAPVAPAAPADLVLQCAADVPAPLDLTATDNCNGDITESPTVQITPGRCVNDFIMVRTWTFEDECGNTSSVSQTITVKDDLAPVAPAAPADLVLENVDDIPPPISLTATDNCSGEITVDPTVQVIPGACAGDFVEVRTWTFADECGNNSSVSQTITVIDTSPPVITVSTEPLVLWPPNHQYYTVNVADFVLAVDDNCGLLSTGDVLITQVTSDEPEDVNGGGDGNTLNDILTGQDCQSVDLRVERQGSGNGRVYTLTVAVTDENGNMGTAEYEVHIPKSKKKNAINDGAAYSISGCGNGSGRLAGNTPILNDNNGLFEDILIYPNPVRDIVTIELTNNFTNEGEPIELHLYNMVGVDVSITKKQTISSNKLEIDMVGLPSGVYILIVPYQGDFIKRKINKY